MAHQKQILDSTAMQRAITRLAHEILERNHGAQDLVLVGIQRRGVSLATALAREIQRVEGTDVPQGCLDITFYRDDLSMLAEHPIMKGTDIPFDIHNKIVVLVDDVLYTGRTVRAAIESLMDMGRPKCIQLAVLIDRGHRELPIRADYVGRNVPTSHQETVEVLVDAFDGQNAVMLSTLDD